MGAGNCKCDGSASCCDAEVLGNNLADDVSRTQYSKVPSDWVSVDYLKAKQQADFREAFLQHIAHIRPGAPVKTIAAKEPATCETITAKELGKLVRSLGTNPADEELEEMIQAAGAYGEDAIDCETFLCIMAQLLAGEGSTCVSEDADGTDTECVVWNPEIKLLVAHFEAFDGNRTGFISRDVLPEVMFALGEEDDSEFEILLARQADDKDQINYRQFLKAFRSG